MNPLRRWGPWLAVTVMVAVLFTIGLTTNASGPRDNSERVNALAKQLKCLVCAGETVFESRTEWAETVRDDIRRQVGEGADDSQILQRAADNYGDEILLVPTAEGANLVLWIAPALVAVVGLAAMGVAFRRWQAGTGAAPTEADRALVAAALHPEVDEEP